jgi:broad specificity phosphatase PhoE
VAIELVFETHSTTVDNEQGRATGWLPGQLSEQGLAQARELGRRQAITRVGSFLGDLPLRWNSQRILVIGHVATRWGLDHHLGAVPLEDLIEQEFTWHEGWEYQVS